MRRAWCVLTGGHRDRLMMVAWAVGDWRPVTMCINCRRQVKW